MIRQKHYTNTVKFDIEIINIEKNIPSGYIAEFNCWLKRQAIECPLGHNFEYFHYNDNHMVDIGVEFTTSINHKHNIINNFISNTELVSKELPTVDDIKKAKNK